VRTFLPQKNRGTGAVHGMFMFMLLAAFALLSVIVVLVGARVYRSVDQRSGENYETRTALSYIAGKIRASDASGQVDTAWIVDREVLVLSAEYDSITYVTYIYVHNGRLMEYFGRIDATFAPAYGDMIAKAQDFHCQLDDKLLSFSITGTDGTLRTMTLFIQSGEVET